MPKIKIQGEMLDLAKHIIGTKKGEFNPATFDDRYELAVAELVKAVTKKGKKKRSLTPMTFSLLHATDFAHRLVHNILPPLKAGMIVLADRYVYTAFGRDVARGVDADWVRGVYSFAPRPDLALYFRVPIEVSLARLLAGRTKLKYHEAGMDVGLAPDPAGCGFD